jgi:hypothetical protein
LITSTVVDRFSRHGDEDVVFEGDIADQGSARIPVNAGMAIVTPAQHIADLLLRDDFDANRDALEVRTPQPQD